MNDTLVNENIPDREQCACEVVGNSCFSKVSPDGVNTVGLKICDTDIVLSIEVVGHKWKKKSF